MALDKAIKVVKKQNANDLVPYLEKLKIQFVESNSLEADDEHDRVSWNSVGAAMAKSYSDLLADGEKHYRQIHSTLNLRAEELLNDIREQKTMLDKDKANSANMDFCKMLER